MHIVKTCLALFLEHKKSYQLGKKSLVSSERLPFGGSNGYQGKETLWGE
jgi:hypothetical protein